MVVRRRSGMRRSCANYADVGIICIMATGGLCRPGVYCPGKHWDPRLPCQHNSEALEECHELVGGLITSGFPSNRGGSVECTLLDRHVGVEIDTGRFHALVS